MAHANPYTPGQVETLEQAQNELVKLADVPSLLGERTVKRARSLLRALGVPVLEVSPRRHYVVGEELTAAIVRLRDSAP